MKGKDIIAELKKRFRAETDKELASSLGITTVSIQNWKNRNKWTLRQIAGLVHAASQAGAAGLRRSAVRPLVEFFRIDLCKSRPGSKWELFSIHDREDLEHPYRSGLRNELDSTNGVYIFFDSRGQAIYAGKARKQTLWREMNLALNRPRGEVQKLKRVTHPSRKVAYKTTDEKARQIVDEAVPLFEIANYFSAYDVEGEMIDDIEALLVRSFANNLLNKRMERFSRHKQRNP